MVPFTGLPDEALMPLPLPEAVSSVNIPDSIEAETRIVLIVLLLVHLTIGQRICESHITCPYNIVSNNAFLI